MNEVSGDCYVAGLSETQNPTIFQFAVTGVKDKLLEANFFMWIDQGLVGKCFDKIICCA